MSGQPEPNALTESTLDLLESNFDGRASEHVYDRCGEALCEQQDVRGLIAMARLSLTLQRRDKETGTVTCDSCGADLDIQTGDLTALLTALDPSTRARVLREAIPESDWARITDEDDEAAQRFLEMSDEGFDAAIVAAGGDPERHHRASQAMVRWTRKLAEMHGELTTTRAEVERLRALVKLALSRGLDNAVSEPLRAALDAPDPLGPVNYGMDSDE